jgi:hypothetical protein
MAAEEDVPDARHWFLSRRFVLGKSAENSEEDVSVLKAIARGVER